MSRHRPQRDGDSGGEESQASFSGPIRKVGSGIMYAVVILIVLGAFYNTAIIATPWQSSPPTDRALNETHTGVAAGAEVQMNVSAAWYYDGQYATGEVVYNATSGAQLTEGTDYQFYPSNGTLVNLGTSSVDFEVSYSYYQLGTWQKLMDTFARYGETAFIMIGVGFIALGAAVALRYMGAFGGQSGGR